MLYAVEQDGGGRNWEQWVQQSWNETRPGLCLMLVCEGVSKCAALYEVL